MKEYECPVILYTGNPVFPNCFSTLSLSKSPEITAVDKAFASDDRLILLVVLRDDINTKKLEDKACEVGTLCHIDAIINNGSNNTLKISVNGLKRVWISEITKEGDSDTFTYIGKGEELKTIPLRNKERAKSLFNEVKKVGISLLPNMESMRYIDQHFFFNSEASLELLIDHLTMRSLAFDSDFRQSILSEVYLEARALLFLDVAKSLNEQKDIQDEIDEEVAKRTNKNQREYLLREQMKVVQEKLSEFGDSDGEEEKILDRINNDNYPNHIKERVRQEMKKLNQLPAGALESSMLLSYINWLVDLPWGKKTVDNNDLDNARRVLDEDHYGLEKVKERIIEYLAVKSMTNSLKAPILCLYGPPGVGKTSLAKSVARALGRKFVKASLGGTSDEAEIRGHRRTYVASMPGKIIKGIKNAGVSNPVFLLDEIDKLTANMHGDPASALLEVLDPEQNCLFQDNYLEEPYDLSNVLFICTANYLENIPPALKDRLELIELNTYTEIEKLNIAKEHLVSKQCEINGLKKGSLVFEDEAILKIIRFYTREAGVRELERKIATCCRKAIVELLTHQRKRKIVVNEKKVKEYLGTEIFDYTHEDRKDSIGVVTGLAYTQFGGDILPIEVNYFKGKGSLVLTGNLGNVMKESASIALDYIKSNAKRYEIDEDFFMEHDIHIHVPEGAVPKDGPSAGIAITTAIVSAIKKIPLKSYVAMTGEVNLRGEALAIGGLKEKTLAALRSGIKTVLIPKENNRNIADLPQEVKDGIEIKRITCVDDALKVTLVNHDFL